MDFGSEANSSTRRYILKIFYWIPGLVIVVFLKLLGSSIIVQKTA